MFDVGRVCMKTAGREAGRYCAVIKKIDAHYVEVTGPVVATGVRRRRCNIAHLEPLEHVIEIKAEAGDEQVLKAMESAGIFSKLKIEAPTAEKINAYEAMRAEKEKKKAGKEEEKARQKAGKEEPKKEEEAAGVKIGEILKEAEKKGKEKAKEEKKKEKTEKKAEGGKKEQAKKAAPKKEEAKVPGKKGKAKEKK